MRVNAMTEKFEDVTVLGHPMLFTCARVDRDTVPKGLYVYKPLERRWLGMNSKRISLRFNLDDKDDLAAWEYLHRLNVESINKEIISMINASRQNSDLRELLRQTITVAMQGMALQPVEKKPEISENDLAALDFINSF